ncbi:MAG: 3-hydroxybutyryl-CoA dehydrogenase [Pseudomonadota bacterium]
MSDLPTIAIVGPGRMGRGMAHAFAYTGHSVRIVDLKPRSPEAARASLAAARDEVARTVGVMARAGALPDSQVARVLARVTTHDAAAADAAIASADVVLEGVPEVMEVKQAAFARIGAAARPDALIASTTSTFLVESLADFVPGPERFLNTHWLNPAYLVPLVEVSPGRRTDPAVLARAMALLRGAGKVPVECAAAPGFIVPRIQALALNEAARIVAEGVATAEAVDTATRVGLGLRFAIIGLIEFIDWGGGDILFYASKYLEGAFGDARFAAPEIVEQNMARGATGMRAGAGFHDWQDRDIAAYQTETLTKLIGLLDHLKLLPPPR